MFENISKLSNLLDLSCSDISAEGINNLALGKNVAKMPYLAFDIIRDLLVENVVC